MNFKALLSWSKEEFTDLPWRRSRSLYRTLVSEIMLQQTTVGTVRNHYERFLRRFPDLEALANASEEELLVAWKGLGYYRRARSLKKIAESIFRDHGGKFPKAAAQLEAIPGIGPYTASALISIGMDRRAVAVDANIERVIARLYGLQLPKGPKLQKEIYSRFEAGEILSHDFSYRDLNEALMDLGRTFCQARRAVCELCPMRKDCSAFRSGTPLAYPAEGKVKVAKVDKGHELNLLRIYVMKDEKILVYKKETHEWLSGQYEVPTFILSSTDAKLAQYPLLDTPEELDPAHTYKTGITKYNIVNSVLVMDEKKLKKFKYPRDLEWRHISSEASNFSTATLKGLSIISGKKYQIT